MKRFLDMMALIAIILSSAAVTIGVSIYVMHLPPVALKSDITTVQQTAIEALKQTHIEQKVQDKSSAAVSTLVDTHGRKIQSADDRISKLENEYATLKTRVDLLDGYKVPPPVKHAHQH
jgi:hypothetical protein